jgi:hypothetical protein
MGMPIRGAAGNSLIPKTGFGLGWVEFLVGLVWFELKSSCSGVDLIVLRVL